MPIPVREYKCTIGEGLYKEENGDYKDVSCAYNPINKNICCVYNWCNNFEKCMDDYRNKQPWKPILKKKVLECKSLTLKSLKKTVE